MEFNWIDIILAIPLAVGIVMGLIKGIVKSLGSLLGLVIGIVVAYLCAEPFNTLLSEYLTWSPTQLYVLAFVLLFVVVVLLCALLVKIIDKFLSIVTLAWLNKLLGGCFGLLKYALLLSVLINLVDIVDERFNWIQPQVKEQSFLYKPIKAVVPTLMPYVHFYFDQQNETTRQ